MLNTFDDKLFSEISDFNLPSFNEIPNVGLFLEQTTKYISEYLSPLGENITLTGSMISNYVKKGIIKNPIKKQYAREEIAYLFFIAITKSVLSLEDILILINLQKERSSCEQAYEYFRKEFKSTLNQVFEVDELKINPHKASDIKEIILIQNTIITVCHKIYLDKYFDSVK